MSEFRICRVCRQTDWLRIHHLYKSAFPAGERKPFAVIRSMWKTGKTDIWSFEQNGRFAGFAATINGSGLVLVDYLAVTKRCRGQGVGSRALQALCDQYPGCGLFAEIESPFEDVPNRSERLRRKAFYERCGFMPSHTMANVFGTKMELMCHGVMVDFDTYFRFYCAHYNPRSGEHIRYEPYPEE